MASQLSHQAPSYHTRPPSYHTRPPSYHNRPPSYHNRSPHRGIYQVASPRCILHSVDPFRCSELSCQDHVVWCTSGVCTADLDLKRISHTVYPYMQSRFKVYSRFYSLGDPDPWKHPTRLMTHQGLTLTCMCTCLSMTGEAITPYKHASTPAPA